MPEDFESKKSWVRGYIVRELCDLPSNFRCEGDLDSFLKGQGIVGIAGIDTRALTKKLRDVGTMNGMILSGECPEITEDLKNEIKNYRIVNAVDAVSNKGGESLPLAPETVVSTGSTTISAATPSPKGDTPLKTPVHVILWDFGAKKNIQRELEKRDCKVTVVPYNTTVEKILSLNPDGIMLSNGPGDPAENTGVIAEIKKICDSIAENNSGSKKISIFGICLGHQMLALARGAKTRKLKYGHRGGNHPCKDLRTGRVYITSQNHGYAVETENLPPYAQLSFINSNDNTCEGLEYTDIPAFSVQFHPEACGGPHDTNFLFDRFLEMMEANCAVK